MHGPFFIFLAAALWGLDGILRRVLYDLPPITIVFFEHLIGLVLILPFLLKSWRVETLKKREWYALGTIALLSGVLGTLFFTMALQSVQYISFSVVFLIQKLQPLFALTAAWIVLREKPVGAYAWWAVLALIAGYFVTFPNGIVRITDGAFTGALLALLAAAAWGTSTALSRYALLNHSQTFITGMRFLLTVPLAFVFVYALGATESLTQVTPTQSLYLLVIACSTGMAALWLYYYGLRTTPVRVATIVELVFPIVAILIDYYLYGVVLAWTQYVAAIVLLFAIRRVSLLTQTS